MGKFPDALARSYIGTLIWLGLVRTVAEHCDVMNVVGRNLICWWGQVLPHFDIQGSTVRFNAPECYREIAGSKPALDTMENNE